MYSLEKLKELAIKQMRMAADLYNAIEQAEAVLREDNDHHNKLLLRSCRDFRKGDVANRFGLTISTEENDLWDEVMEELD